MDFDEAKKRVIKLRKSLNKWNKSYYENNVSLVDDSLFDETLKELFELEKKYPKLITKNSPTQTVGKLESSSFEKIEHKIPMLSLKNGFNESDLFHFDGQIKNFLKEKELENVEYYVEPKIDGLSISLIYKNGLLFRAITRGDGITGEDVTNNIKQISDIPLEVDIETEFEVRGEIYMPLNVFEKINNKRKKNDEILLANPRNAASGTIRQLNPLVVKERNLKSIIYWAYNIDKNDYLFESQSKTIENLSKLNFSTSHLSKKANNVDEVIKIIKNIEKQRSKLKYEIDGIVIKVNNSNFYNDIGNTSKFPRWAIAYKFPAEVKETKLLNIFPTVGRTGRITYNAKLEPVEISGTTVRYATLHNAEYIKDLDLRIGDIVRIKKAGEIIPKVISVNISDRKRDAKIWIEDLNCQYCNSILEKNIDEVDQYCFNEKCPSRMKESILHFISRDAMNIEGLSVKQIEKFINLGWINSFADIYRLKDKRLELLKLDGYKERSVNVLLDSIEKTKNTTLNRFIFALGIRHIGKKTANDLAKKFKSIDNIIEAKLDELINESDFGEVKSNSIVNYFKNKDNLEQINELINLGLNLKEVEIKKINENKFTNKKIVITGTIEGLKRDEVKSYFENFGAKVTTSVSKSTDYLIVGSNPSVSKISKIENENKIIKIKNINELIV